MVKVLIEQVRPMVYGEGTDPSGPPFVFMVKVLTEQSTPWFIVKVLIEQVQLMVLIE